MAHQVPTLAPWPTQEKGETWKYFIWWRHSEASASVSPSFSGSDEPENKKSQPRHRLALLILSKLYKAVFGEEI